MGYFETILTAHNLEKCPEYLWQIRVTAEEYANLKQLLARQIHIYNRNCGSVLKPSCKPTLLSTQFHKPI